MRTASRLTAMAALVALTWCGGAAAGSLSCRSVNGNTVCAGPGGHSCQTVDGRTVCTSGDGDAVQIFGGATPDLADPDLADPDLDEPDYELDEATGDLVIERGGPAGRLSLRRENGELHIDTGRLQLDLR
jgi:hypothetical protein